MLINDLNKTHIPNSTGTYVTDRSHSRENGRRGLQAFGTTEGEEDGDYRVVGTFGEFDSYRCNDDTSGDEDEDMDTSPLFHSEDDEDDDNEPMANPMEISDPFGMEEDDSV